jgi:hypothetical protein
MPALPQALNQARSCSACAVMISAAQCVHSQALSAPHGQHRADAPCWLSRPQAAARAQQPGAGLAPPGSQRRRAPAAVISDDQTLWRCLATTRR